MQAIYAIENTVNNNIYIGSSVNFRNRKSEHMNDLRKNKHHSVALQRAFNKYGEPSFIFKILEVVANRKDLISREQHYLDSLLPKYNTCKKAYSLLGFKKSAEDNIKNSIRNTGVNNGNAKITKENIEEIKTLINTMSNKSIALRFRVSESTIERTCKKYGIQKNKKFYSAESKEKLGRIGAANSLKSIAKKVFIINNDGSKEIFNSISMAARHLKRNPSTLLQAINESRKCAGVMVYLLNPED